jgi:hypothetical protein
VIPAAFRDLLDWLMQNLREISVRQVDRDEAAN